MRQFCTKPPRPSFISTARCLDLPRRMSCLLWKSSIRHPDVLIGQWDNRAQSGAIEPLLERSEEDGEPELARAMRGSNALDFQIVVQDARNALHFLTRR